MNLQFLHFTMLLAQERSNIMFSIFDLQKTVNKAVKVPKFFDQIYLYEKNSDLVFEMPMKYQRDHFDLLLP